MADKKHKSIYELNLHERTWIDNLGKEVVRVPGGWIYADWDTSTDNPYNPIFIPFVKESIDNKD